MSNAAMTPTTSREEWSKAGKNATDAASSVGEMAGHAASAVGVAAKQVATDIGQAADDMSACAGSRIDHLGRVISENTPSDGMLGTASQAVAHTVQRGGQYLEETKLSGIATALTDLIRQHPISALATGIGIGFLLGRAMRN